MNDSSTQQEKPKNRPIDKRAKRPGINRERQQKHARVIADNVRFSSEREKIIALGYSDRYADQPSRVKSSKSFAKLLEEYMPDEEVLQHHDGLMRSRRLDHMVFPTNIEDDEISEMLADVNCVLRKVVHGEQAKHAYFWSPDNKARKEALDMLYKLKGKYAPEEFKDVSPYKDLSTEELAERRKAALDFYRKRKPSS